MLLWTTNSSTTGFWKKYNTLRKWTYKDDYRLIKALSALYELQDYLANRIAESARDMEYAVKETKKDRRL